jgi:hypothetical protein
MLNFDPYFGNDGAPAQATANESTNGIIMVSLLATRRSDK